MQEINSEATESYFKNQGSIFLKPTVITRSCNSKIRSENSVGVYRENIIFEDTIINKFFRDAENKQ